MQDSSLYEDLSISTYVISLKERKDSLKHINDQFTNKPEFDITIFEASRCDVETFGLWNSILRVINLAKSNDDDVIVLCEEDHKFTENYNKEEFFKEVIAGNELGLNLLLGGISSFNQAIRITKNKYWVDIMKGTQFVVIYSRFFDAILREPYDESIIPESKLSEMTSSKMVIYPFISAENDQLFKNSISRMNIIAEITSRYRKDFYL